MVFLGMLAWHVHVLAWQHTHNPTKNTQPHQSHLQPLIHINRFTCIFCYLTYSSSAYIHTIMEFLLTQLRIESEGTDDLFGSSRSCLDSLCIRLCEFSMPGSWLCVKQQISCTDMIQRLFKHLSLHEIFWCKL